MTPLYRLLTVTGHAPFGPPGTLALFPDFPERLWPRHGHGGRAFPCVLVRPDGARQDARFRLHGMEFMIGPGQDVDLGARLFVALQGQGAADAPLGTHLLSPDEDCALRLAPSLEPWRG
ncbi:hypothetical protein [Pseudoponticoccus marisrubri]|uniref:Uncharacterized protein n=1 Tax=Pseudoponticoccus marisrubri TaxID=1685382 RepID=A0A0W7WIQ5_9RHOB|nr:hypothetical protein [Pseudoponticoccus marisrubri]KUF10441.1 hypothetical protein AVJ23_11150 [Pseudoponticoccus marisrubri]